MHHDSRPRFGTHMGLVIAGAVFVLGGAGNAFAQAHPLFSLSEEVREPAIRSEDPHDAAERELLKEAGQTVEPESAEVIRHRIARIDLAHLDALRGALTGEREGPAPRMEEPSAGEREELAPRMEDPGKSSGVRLNLFDDAAFDLMDLDISATPRGFTLSATVKGSLFGTATLAVNGDVVSGLVRVQRGIYTIRSVGGGRVEIRHVRPPPPDLAPPEPPLLTAGAPRAGFVHKEAAEDDGDAVVDLLILWSPAAREEAGGPQEIETIVDHLVAVANRAYADSGAHVRFNVAHMQEVDVEDDGRINLFYPLVGQHHPHLDYRDIRQTALRMRDVVGADLIHFLGSGAGCQGRAQTPTSLDNAHEAFIGISKQACGSSYRVDVPAGSIEVTTFIAQPLDDMRKEPHEVLVLELEGAAYHLADGVSLPVRRFGWTNVWISQSVGLIVDPEGPFHDVPLFPSAGEQRQGFVRVVNGGRRSATHVEAFAEDGTEPSPATLALPSGGAAHFNSGDLEDGNWDKGLGRGIGPGQGDWRLRLWGNDLQVLSYIRTADGFLTSMHDVVPRGADGRYRVPTFNPGSNWRQESRLRLANAGGETAAIEIFGVDDAGARAGPVRLQLEGGMARTLTARQLESGDGLEGALGEGGGKWRLVVGSDQPVFVVSLMASESGHLTNLSTVPANKERRDGETVHHVPLFLSAADAFGRQGFVRVVNKGAETASVRVRAYDGSGEYPTSLRVPGNGVAHFNSQDLEMGSADKGIDGVGSGSGNWRLELATGADVDVLAYVRHEDGFLTNMHDLVAATATTDDGEYRYAVATFNPGSNRNQASSLLLANSAETAATVTVAGVDDRGLAQGRIDVVVPGGRTVTLSAADLESGGEGFDGRLGDGAGKWRLDVASSEPLWVMNLLESATGRLTNLSSVPGGPE